MAVKIVISNGGVIRGVYSAATLEEALVSLVDGDTYEVVDAQYELPDVDMTQDIHYIRHTARANKVAAVASIVVQVGDKSFDGDEISQGRMLRAISIASITGETSTEWKLADNTVVVATIDELKEALALSGKAMSDIWLKE